MQTHSAGSAMLADLLEAVPGYGHGENDLPAAPLWTCVAPAEKGIFLSRMS